MANEKGHIISIREFSRRLDVSDTAVRKQINSSKYPTGAITEGKALTDGGKPALYWETASREWVEAGCKVGEMSIINATAELQPGEGEDVDVLPGMPPKRELLTDAPAPKVVDETMRQAKRGGAVYDTAIKKIKYEQLLGELVYKKQVYKVFYEYGQNLRDKLLQMPDTIFTQLENLIKNDKNKEAYNLLYSSLETILISLTDGPAESKLQESSVLREDGDTTN